jgi:hypothetical protein
MNEIVINTTFGDVVIKRRDHIEIEQQFSNHPYSIEEIHKLINGLFEAIGEPTREQCFEAGRIYGQQDINTTFTDYINAYKNGNDV